MSLKPPHQAAVQESDQQEITSHRPHIMSLEPRHQALVQNSNQQLIISEAPPQTMPTTILTLPRELRDEIYDYLAISLSFAFLLTCHQINEEGTPLLYKYGIYHRRALIHRKENLPPRPKPVPIAKIQNIYISMPPPRFFDGNNPEYEISRRTTQRLNRFAGTAIQRGICHVNLQQYTLSRGLAAVLRGFCGFEIVRVEWALRCLEINGETWYSITGNWAHVRKKMWMSRIKDKLKMALGKAKWRSEKRTIGNQNLEVVIAEFRPR